MPCKHSQKRLPTNGYPNLQRKKRHAKIYKSETPARIMGVLDRKGTLERGKDADIIALDRDLNVRAVWAMGQLVEGTNKLF